MRVLVLHLLLPLVHANKLLRVFTGPDSVVVGDNFTFPDYFVFGTSTAAYQVEGGWDQDGKGPSIWDTLTHTHPEYVEDRSNGDVACDSYHNFKEDVKILQRLGVDFYRFSISWSRVLPNGHVNVVNQAGIDFYNNLIDELLKFNIQPMVNMYHWDLPQKLQDLGGWANPVMAQYFEDYARFLYIQFGDKVKMWSTMNEPENHVVGYASKTAEAPNVNSPGIGDYLAAHTLILAHARAYRLYDKEFRHNQRGKVSISLNLNWCEPLTGSEADQQACERHKQFVLGAYAHPIFSEEGDYPPLVKEIVKSKSLEQGFYRSRLPEFTQQERDLVKGAYDFFAINTYTTFLGSNSEDGAVPSRTNDRGVEYTQSGEWIPSASSWLKVVPWGFRRVLKWIAKEYNNPPLIVTENGFSDTGQLNDIGRIAYYTSHLLELLKAIKEDGCKIFGYTAWSLLDNFEWNAGYTEKFGLYQVNFSKPERTRIPKASTCAYAEIIKKRGIPKDLRCLKEDCPWKELLKNNNIQLFCNAFGRM